MSGLTWPKGQAKSDPRTVYPDELQRFSQANLGSTSEGATPVDVTSPRVGDVPGETQLDPGIGPRGGSSEGIKPAF